MAPTDRHIDNRQIPYSLSLIQPSISRHFQDHTTPAGTPLPPGPHLQKGGSIRHVLTDNIIQSPKIRTKDVRIPSPECTPVSLPARDPFAKKSRVGTAEIWKASIISGFMSASHFPIVTIPANSTASSSITGGHRHTRTTPLTPAVYHKVLVSRNEIMDIHVSHLSDRTRESGRNIHPTLQIPRHASRAGLRVHPHPKYHRP